MQQTKWKKELSVSIKDTEILLKRTGNRIQEPWFSVNAQKSFPLKVPEKFVSRITFGNPDDPLLKQVLPRHEEGINVKGFTHDPLEETKAQVAPGLLKKYHGRALLIVTGVCAIHCRYCFRRNFAYSDAKSTAQWQFALEQLKKDNTINEIILSGGDPLVLTDRLMKRLVNNLAEIPHLKRLRIHTRVPIVIPERVNTQMLAWLTGSRLKPVMVVHCNHPNELDSTVHDAIQLLNDANVPVFNQSVLLKGVNDTADTLVELSEKLFETGIIAYYLNLLDPVAGTAHFAVEENHAIQLINQLRRRLPGYLVPRLVKELSGAEYKIPVN